MQKILFAHNCLEHGAVVSLKKLKRRPQPWGEMLLFGGGLP
jgi:hypothetical protein